MTKHIPALLLMAVLATPAVALAAPPTQDTRSSHETTRRRVYDRAHKDYHVWDDREDQAYHSWLTEQHRDFRDYSKLKRKDQNAYWEWRHAHPDTDRR